MNRIPKMSILLTILYTCRRSNGIPALHSISPVIGMVENAVSINQTSWKPAIGTPRINTHFMIVESARHPWCSDGENHRVRSHTFRVIVSMTKTFYVSYSDINLSIHAPPLIAVKLEPIMYSTDIKWKMLRRRKKKKTFEDLKKSHWEPAYFLDCMEMALHVIIRYFYLKYFKLNGASIKNVN